MVCGCAEEGCQDKAQGKPQPVEDEAQIVADGGEDGVDLIADASLQVVAVEKTVRLLT